jgi:endonuclease III
VHAMMPATSLSRLVEQLEAFYGRPEPPEVTDPWALIVWENISYLVDDARRQQAMAALRAEIGITPAEILAAPNAKLMKAAVRGIVPEQSVAKLRRCAEIALEEFDGDLQPILKRPLAQAKKAFKRFPAIGDPGAEKILLFTRAYPILALESNGLRVLLRLGFGSETPNYSATYRSVQEAVAPDLVKEFPWLIKAHQLLRRHGQELCRRSRPHCRECPLFGECPWPAANPGG